MYIRSYQIRNVLNVYGKQLSHGKGGSPAKGLPTANAKDRINISADGQRKSIMDKISSQIMESISQTGPEKRFETVLEDQLSDKSGPQRNVSPDTPQDFKYTTIDKNNRKITNTLAFRGFSPKLEGTATDTNEKPGKNPDQGIE